MPEQIKLELKNLLTRNQLYIVAGVFVIILTILIATFYTANPLPSGSTVVQVDISYGESLEKVIDSLYSKKIIPSKFNMRVAVFLKGAGKKIKAGSYFIDKPVSYLELVDILVNEDGSMQKLVTIPEGIEQPKLASLLKRELGIDSSQFMILSGEKSFIMSLGIDTNNLEGYLLPDTYYILNSGGAAGVMRKLSFEMKKFFNGKLTARLKEMKMSLHQVLTLASIIDGESNNFPEFKRISGVYHNRLKRGMALQADPTIEYIIRDRLHSRITRKDLQIKSKYNTYLNTGLPPGPINNPGKDAILAALYPEKNNYLYFVANGNGGHIFASTYEQHSINVQKYRRWLRSQN